MNIAVADPLSCLLNVSNLHKWMMPPNKPPYWCLGQAAKCLLTHGEFYHEPVLRTLSGLLLLDSDTLLPEGAVVDAGAHYGHEACWYSSLSGRVVHALDPVPPNAAWMAKCNAGNPTAGGRQGVHPRLRPAELPCDWWRWGARTVKVQNMGLGREDGRLNLRPHLTQAKGPGGMMDITDMEHNSSNVVGNSTNEQMVSVPIVTLDSLIGDGTLAFAHLDVEEMEAEVLKGGWRVLRGLATTPRRPFLTVETSSRVYEWRHTKVVGQIGFEMARAGYTTYVVEERCGGHGCRNYLGVPSESTAAFERTRAFTVMREAGNLLTKCEPGQLWKCLITSLERARNGARRPRPAS